MPETRPQWSPGPPATGGPTSPDLARIVATAARWWWALALGAIAGAALALAAGGGGAPTYQASTRLLVGPIGGEYSLLRAAGQQAETDADLVTSEPVLRAARVRLGDARTVAQLRGDVSASADDVTRLLKITATARGPAAAAATANALAAELARLTAADDPGSGHELTVVDRAAPAGPSDNRANALVAIAAFAGLLAALTLAVLADLTQSRVATGRSSRRRRPGGGARHRARGGVSLLGAAALFGARRARIVGTGIADDGSGARTALALADALAAGGSRSCSSTPTPAPRGPRVWASTAGTWCRARWPATAVCARRSSARALRPPRARTPSAPCGHAPLEPGRRAAREEPGASAADAWSSPPPRPPAWPLSAGRTCATGRSWPPAARTRGATAYGRRWSCWTARAASSWAPCSPRRRRAAVACRVQRRHRGPRPRRRRRRDGRGARMSARLIAALAVAAAAVLAAAPAARAAGAAATRCAPASGSRATSCARCPRAARRGSSLERSPTRSSATPTSPTRTPTTTSASSPPRWSPRAPATDAARKAAAGVMDAIGTEKGGRTLALARGLIAYVVAADLIDLRHFDRGQGPQLPRVAVGRAPREARARRRTRR